MCVCLCVCPSNPSHSPEGELKSLSRAGVISAELASDMIRCRELRKQLKSRLTSDGDAGAELSDADAEAQAEVSRLAMETEDLADALLQRLRELGGIASRHREETSASTGGAMSGRSSATASNQQQDRVQHSKGITDILSDLQDGVAGGKEVRNPTLLRTHPALLRAPSSATHVLLPRIHGNG